MAKLQDAISPTPHSSVLISTNYLKITSLPNPSNGWIYSEGWGYAPFINICIMSSDSSLFMELSTYFNIRAKDGVIPRVLTLPCFPEFTYLMLQKGDKHVFFWTVGKCCLYSHLFWWDHPLQGGISPGRIFPPLLQCHVGDPSQGVFFLYIPVQSAQPCGSSTKTLLSAHLILFYLRCALHIPSPWAASPWHSSHGERAISDGFSQQEKSKQELLPLKKARSVLQHQLEPPENEY